MMKCMTGNEKINAADLDSLQIVKYPDMRLKEVCTPIETVDDKVRDLAKIMCKMMLESNGVGLAAPQVGITVRLFVASPTFSPDDLRVYINPRIIATEGSQEDEEGCLSLPGVSCKVKRANVITIEAQDLDGNVFQEEAEEFTARIFQHENDHLNGMTLVNRMGTVAKLTNRKALKSLEEDYQPA